MYRIAKDYRFAAAHHIPGHTGGCERLHGHNYRVRVVVESAGLDELGMVLDFAALKAWQEEILGRFDHQVLNELPPFDEIPPTAEALAEHVYLEMRDRLPAAGRVRVARVEVWENDDSCASFQEGP